MSATDSTVRPEVLGRLVTSALAQTDLLFSLARGPEPERDLRWELAFGHAMVHLRVQDHYLLCFHVTTLEPTPALIDTLLREFVSTPQVRLLLPPLDEKPGTLVLSAELLLVEPSLPGRDDGSRPAPALASGQLLRLVGQVLRGTEIALRAAGVLPEDGARPGKPAKRLRTKKR